MAYKIEFTRNAEKQFKALPRKIQIRLKSRIDVLIDNPRPAGVKKLKKSEDFYRVRDGDYRIIYQIKDNGLIVVIIKIGHRKNIYR